MAFMGAILPHGSEIIPELAGDHLELFAQTRLAVEEIAAKIIQFKPDTIIVATPHGIKLDRHISIATSEWLGGSLADHGNEVSVQFANDQEFAQHLLQATREADIPAIGTNYGSSSGPFSKIPLDWGALIPLWFLGDLANRAKVVLISPTRDIKREQLVSLGHLIHKTSEKLGRRTLLIASADQGHGHLASGPYGYAPESASYDQSVCQLIRDQNLAKLLEFDQAFVDAAKPDSLWQMLILHGLIEKYPMTGKLLSYQVPTYYGMLCAIYEA